MLNKLVRLSKRAWLEFKFKKRIKITGYPIIGKRVCFNIRGDSFLELGNRVAFFDGVNVGIVNGKCIIGDETGFNRNCMVMCRDSIMIGTHCSFGPNVIIYDHDHVFSADGFQSTNFKTTPIVIEDNCWVGASVVILRGTHIGEGCVIGAGTVVSGVIPPHTIVKSDRSLKMTPIV